MTFIILFLLETLNDCFCRTGSKLEPIKDQLGCPVQTLSRDQRQGLQNTTATEIESNHIPLLVRAHPLMGLWIKQVIFIAKTVLWLISQITEAGSSFLFFLSNFVLSVLNKVELRCILLRCVLCFIDSHSRYYSTE